MKPAMLPYDRPGHAATHAGHGVLAAILLFLAPLAAGAGTSSEPVPPSAWLDGAEQLLVAQSGRELTVGLPDGELVHAVFYAPLGLVWLLDAARTEVPRTGRVVRSLAEDRALLIIRWDDADITTLLWPDPLPDVSVTGGYHPLAAFHDRLLAQPLARPVANLPTGSRFEAPAGAAATGLVRKPGAPDPAITLWQSLGDHIVITRPDGQVNTLHWREIDTALDGEAQ